MSFLINKCLFLIGSMDFKQDIDIPMGIGAVLFWVNLFFCFFAYNYIKQLISNGSAKLYNYHVDMVSRFINNLCAINDGNEFLTSFKNICLKELGLKVEHQGN